jgi:hypothetical protein
MIVVLHVHRMAKALIRWQGCNRINVWIRIIRQGKVDMESLDYPARSAGGAPGS